MLIERKYPHVESMDELVPLAFQILRFKMNDFRRKALRRGEFNPVSVDDVPLTDTAADPYEEYRRRQLQDRLNAALRKLEGRCREIFRMKLEGRSFAEIQKELGAATINTVYTWDSRCRKSLLELMGGEWERSGEGSS